MKARNTLLEQMVHFRLVNDWRTEQGNLRRKEEKVMPTRVENVLQLDSKGYDIDDKNFKCYSALIPELKGFLGSPNFKHSHVVKKAIFSPDGKYILSASEDKTLKLWEAETGRCLNPKNA